MPAKGGEEVMGRDVLMVQFTLGNGLIWLVFCLHLVYVQRLTEFPQATKMQRTCQNNRLVQRVVLTSPYFRSLKSGALRALLLFVLWGLGTHAVWAQEPAQKLTSGARSWMAEKRGVRPEAIEVAQPDGRLTVPACKDSKGWHYELAHQGTVRARCADPVAQFYLRVSLSNAKASATSGASSNVQNVKDKRPVVVLRQGLLRGTRLTTEHLEVLQWPASNVPQQSIDNMDNAIDAELTRDVLAGNPIRSIDLRPAMLVKRGQTVTLTIRQEGGFAIVAQVEALQDGRKDDTIRLKNRESGRILTGKVVGLNSVEGK